MHLLWPGKTVFDLIEADKANTGALQGLYKPGSFKVSHLLKDNLPEGKEAKLVSVGNHSPKVYENLKKIYIYKKRPLFSSISCHLPVRQVFWEEHWKQEGGSHIQGIQDGEQMCSLLSNGRWLLRVSSYKERCVGVVQQWLPWHEPSSQSHPGCHVSRHRSLLTHYSDYDLVS